MSSLVYVRHFSTLPIATKWQFVRMGIGVAAAFAVLVSGIRAGIGWYRDNYIPEVDISANIPDAAKYGNVQDALQRSKKLLLALEKVDYDPFKVPNKLLHLPDEGMSESRKRFHDGENVSCFTFPDRGSNPEAQEVTKEIAFTTDVYVRHNAKAYKGDVVKTQPSGFVIVGWKNRRITTVPLEDVRVAVIAKKHCFVEVYPGMAAYDPKAMHIPAVEFADGKNTPKFQAFVRSAMATDDTQACRGK